MPAAFSHYLLIVLFRQIVIVKTQGLHKQDLKDFRHIMVTHIDPFCNCSHCYFLKKEKQIVKPRKFKKSFGFRKLPILSVLTFLEIEWISYLRPFDFAKTCLSGGRVVTEKVFNCLRITFSRCL